LAIFHFPSELFPCPPNKLVEKLHTTMLSDILIFVYKFEITIVADNFNIVARFWKDSIFRAEIFAKLSLKY